MKRPLLITIRVAAVVAVALAASTGRTTAQSRQHHHPVYLMGGYHAATTATTYPRGLFLYDKTGTKPTITKLCDVPYNMSVQHNVRMDYDNRALIALARGVSTSLSPWSGCFGRYDPVAKTWTKLTCFPRSGTSYPQATFYEHGFRPVVDQDGDYLFLHYRNQRVTSPTTRQSYAHSVLRYDRVAGTVSTVLTTLQLPVPALTGFSQLGRDIDSGRLMIGGWQVATPHTWDFPVWTLDPERGYDVRHLGYWNYGTMGGWSPAGYTMEQNVRNGRLQGPGAAVANVMSLRSGPGPLTTIAVVTGSPYGQIQHGARFDLQTAASPRMLLGGFYYRLGAWLLEYDVKAWKLTTFDRVLTTAQYSSTYLYWQDFYRSRHIQTVRAGRDRWDVRFSCPQFANRSYVAAVSLSGVRPGVPLPDGRRINLVPDAVTQATLAGALPLLWSSGPGRLDAGGEARGFLDVSTFGRPARGWGVPVWIAMVVLDSSAPHGVAYLPDTYVMRL